MSWRTIIIISVHKLIIVAQWRWLKMLLELPEEDLGMFNGYVQLQFISCLLTCLPSARGPPRAQAWRLTRGRRACPWWMRPQTRQLRSGLSSSARWQWSWPPASTRGGEDGRSPSPTERKKKKQRRDGGEEKVDQEETLVLVYFSTWWQVVCSHSNGAARRNTFMQALIPTPCFTLRMVLLVGFAWLIWTKCNKIYTLVSRFHRLLSE